MAIDRATLLATATRVVQGLSGLVVLVAVAGRLRPGQQGDFITISSLVQMQAAAELGLTTVLVQVASHLSLGRLEVHADADRLDAVTWNRLGTLIGASLGWMALITGAFLVLLLPFGWWFFAHSPRPLEGPWTLAVVATALNLLPCRCSPSARAAAGWRRRGASACCSRSPGAWRSWRR